MAGTLSALAEGHGVGAPAMRPWMVVRVRGDFFRERAGYQYRLTGYAAYRGLAGAYIEGAGGRLLRAALPRPW